MMTIQYENVHYTHVNNLCSAWFGLVLEGKERQRPLYTLERGVVLTMIDSSCNDAGRDLI